MGDTAAKKRSSNIELLRIFAMLMIVAYHIYYHCTAVQLTDSESVYAMQNGWFCNPVFYKKLLILATLSPMGQAGNAIFILISGYFLVRKGKKIDLTSSSKKLLAQSFFAVLMLCLASTVVYEVSSMSLKVVDLTAFNSSAWFIGYYFVIIVFAKLFLNDFLAKLDRSKYLMFLFVTFSLVQFKWSRELIENISNDIEKGLAVLCTGVFLYALGGYIRKYDPFERVKTWVIVGIIVLINIIVYSIFYADTANNILSYSADEGELFYQSLPEFGNYSFIPLCLGIAIFELFRRIKVPDSRVINYLAASTFMVYLIHDNGFFYRIWDTQDWITLLYSSPVLYILKHAGWTVGTFALGTLVYTLFLICKKLVKRCIPFFLKDPKSEEAQE